MAHGAIDVLEDRIVGGVVVSPAAVDASSSPLRFLEGGHPIPTDASLRAGREVMAVAAAAHGTLLVLISGGASALAEVPVGGSDIERPRHDLCRSSSAPGLPIEDINTVRRHLSAAQERGVAGSDQCGDRHAADRRRRRRRCLCDRIRTDPGGFEHTGRRPRHRRRGRDPGTAPDGGARGTSGPGPSARIIAFASMGHRHRRQCGGPSRRRYI